MPWRAWHTAANAALIVAMYLSRACRPWMGSCYPEPRGREDFRNGLDLYFRGSAKAQVIFDLLDPRLRIRGRGENERKSMLRKVIGNRTAFSGLQRDAHRVFASLGDGTRDPASLARGRKTSSRNRSKRSG